MTAHIDSKPREIEQLRTLSNEEYEQLRIKASGDPVDLVALFELGICLFYGTPQVIHPSQDLAVEHFKRLESLTLNSPNRTLPMLANKMNI